MREFKRKRGFFTFAQNSESGNYLDMAYALALSLKATQRDHGYLAVGVTPGEEIPDEYRKVFDEIIEIPWGDMAESESWKLSNEWKFFHMCPYEEAIKLDADMLFLSDISFWWDHLEHKDMWFCSSIKSYRGEPVASDYYRKVFTYDKLPNIYSALSYFKMNENVQEFFTTVEYIFKEYRDYFWEHIREIPQDRATTDVVYALATKIMDKENTAISKMDIMNFVHMKPHCQGWEERYADDNWMKYVPVYFTPELELFVGNYRQTLPFHYHVKSFLTPNIIRMYERKLNV